MVKQNKIGYVLDIFSPDFLIHMYHTPSIHYICMCWFELQRTCILLLNVHALGNPEFNSGSWVSKLISTMYSSMYTCTYYRPKLQLCKALYSIFLFHCVCYYLYNIHVGGDLHYHLTQHGVFNEDEASKVHMYYILENQH